MRTLIAAALLLAACTADAPPPTCDEAIAVWFGNGCTWLVNGQPVPAEADAATYCRQKDAVAPQIGCAAPWEALRVCLAADTTCGCATERDAAEACD